MKSKTIKVFLFLQCILFSFTVLSLSAQQLHVDYIQTKGTPKEFEIEIWISNRSEGLMKLSALNTVFEYQNLALQDEVVSFKLARKFLSMKQPVFSNLVSKNKLRSTMIPVSDATGSIQISKKPELFGTMTVKSNDFISYPEYITPSTQGNPTLQALVYLGDSYNSTALTLSSMSITTDENPLVLKLMPTKVNVEPTWHEVNIYPNPTTNQLYYQIGSETQLPVDEVSVLDAQGRVVMRLAEPAKQEGTIDLTNLTPGMYYLMIKQDETVSRHKVIKI